MAKEKTFGAVTGSLNGFTVRSQINNKKNTGKFGIYAGKRLVQEAPSTKEALEIISQTDFVYNWRVKKLTSKK